MKINPSIFRAYDIRGLYPEQINEEAAYKIGQAFVLFLQQKSRNLNIVIGRDNRLSSPHLHKALIKGIINSGTNVIDIGLSTTPMLYFTVAHYNFDGGINITASHNPPEFNGFKLVREKAIAIGEDNGLRTIKKLTTEDKFLKRKRKVEIKKVISDYAEFNTRGFDLVKTRPFKIVIDTANAVPSILVKEIFKKTKCKIYHLFSKLDGRFPNHSPDPIKKGSLRFLQAEVKKRKANLGVAFDGDGDRIIFTTKEGKIIPGDFITALLSKLILEKNPKEKILYDIRSSNIVKETIKENGGIPEVNRIGHTFIKARMRKENIIFAGEFSGHYYAREHYFCEAPFFALFRVLEEMLRSGQGISELIKPFKRYYHSGEINFRVKRENIREMLERLKKKYSQGVILEIDGLRVDFKDWWFLIRPSNTEPVLRLSIESKTKEKLSKKKKEILKLIKKAI